MTHNICFILLAVDKENNNDPLKIWGLYLSMLAFPGECVNQLGSEVKSIPERSAGWFKILDVWHRLMLRDKKKLLRWSLELIKPYHKLLHNCHVSSWRPHHPDFEIFDGSRLTQPLSVRWYCETHIHPILAEQCVLPVVGFEPMIFPSRHQSPVIAC